MPRASHAILPSLPHACYCGDGVELLRGNCPQVSARPGWAIGSQIRVCRRG